MFKPIKDAVSGAAGRVGRTVGSAVGYMGETIGEGVAAPFMVMGYAFKVLLYYFVAISCSLLICYLLLTYSSDIGKAGVAGVRTTLDTLMGREGYNFAWGLSWPKFDWFGSSATGNDAKAESSFNTTGSSTRLLEELFGSNDAVQQAKKSRMNDLLVHLWNDFISKFDKLCDVIKKAGVSDHTFRAQIRVDVKERVEEYTHDKDLYLLRAILRVENCLKQTSEHSHWADKRKANVIMKECGLDSLRYD